MIAVRTAPDLLSGSENIVRGKYWVPPQRPDELGQGHLPDAGDLKGDALSLSGRAAMPMIARGQEFPSVKWFQQAWNVRRSAFVQQTGRLTACSWSNATRTPCPAHPRCPPGG